MRVKAAKALAWIIAACAVAGTIAAIGLIRWSCLPETHELTRVTSPSGRWDAVVFKSMTGGGAGSVVYFVSIVERGKREIEPAFHASLMDLEGQSLSWTSPDSILLVYSKGDVMGWEKDFASSRSHAPPESLHLVLMQRAGKQ